MAYRLIWSPKARRDLRELMAYISEDDPRAARQFLRHLLHLIERLPTFPISGRIVPEFANPSIREVIRPPCRIVYRVNRRLSRIEVVRIWHAARGTPNLQEG
jgi:toxin ParE1/3/4